MKAINARKWIIMFCVTALISGVLICAVTVYLDPFMHFHRPMTDRFYYTLDNERGQNDGIEKWADYDALITGTSMTENFRTSEADRIFGADFIKVPLSGGSFKEINDNLTRAFTYNPDIKIVIRSLDRYNFDLDKDDLNGYDPEDYLHDSNPLNDIEYLLNRDVVYKHNVNMINGRLSGNPTGVTSFDDYVNWMGTLEFGRDVVMAQVSNNRSSSNSPYLSEQDRKTIRGTVEQNITSLADRYPDAQFYYFLTPYSAAYFDYQKANGVLKKQCDIEEYAASLIIPHKNIHLFLWNRFDMWDDLNNYKDPNHYGEWINSWMLVQMKKDTGRLTEDNYQSEFDKLYRHYNDFDYESLYTQTDYEASYYAAGLLNREINGTEPRNISDKDINLHRASIVSNQYDGNYGVNCVGKNSEFSMTLDATDFRALCFYGRKNSDNGVPSVSVYDSNGSLLRNLTLSDIPSDDQWHQYALNLAGIYGKVRIVFNEVNAEKEHEEYIYSDIKIL